MSSEMMISMEAEQKESLDHQVSLDNGTLLDYTTGLRRKGLKKVK